MTYCTAQLNLCYILYIALWKAGEVNYYSAHEFVIIFVREMNSWTANNYVMIGKMKRTIQYNSNDNMHAYIWIIISGVHGYNYADFCWWCGLWSCSICRKIYAKTEILSTHLKGMFLQFYYSGLYTLIYRISLIHNCIRSWVLQPPPRIFCMLPPPLIPRWMHDIVG